MVSVVPKPREHVADVQSRDIVELMSPLELMPPLFGRTEISLL